MGGNDHSQWCRVMRRFFIHEKISPIFNLSPEDSYHIVKVLRMKVGTELVVVDKDEAIARLEGIRCGAKPTSCPDQIACALKAYRG